MVSAVRDIHTPPDQPDYEVNHDYSKLKEHADDFDYLYRYANAYNDHIGYYRLGRYYLEKTDDMENAEWWLRMAADQGNSLSAYLIYKAYRDRKFDETPSDMMKYLRMAADARFGYAEYRMKLMVCSRMISVSHAITSTAATVRAIRMVLGVRIRGSSL